MFSCPLQKNIFLLEGGRGRGKESSMFSCPLNKNFLLERGRDRGRRAGSPVLLKNIFLLEGGGGRRVRCSPVLANPRVFLTSLSLM